MSGRLLLAAVAALVLAAAGVLVMINAGPAGPGCTARAGSVIELFAPGLSKECRQ